jgi:outer membrane protein assembly factor BamB
MVMAFTSRRLRALAPALLVALASTACWPVPGGNADRTAHNPLESAFTPGTVADLAPAWVADLGPGASGPVVVDRGGVFVRVGQEVSRLQLADGTEAWTWSLPDGVPDFASVSEPLVVGGRVLIGYGIGNLGGNWEGTAVDPVTGATVAGPVARGLLQTARGPIVASMTAAFGSGTPVLVSYSMVDVSGATEVGGGPLAVEQPGSGSIGQMTIGTQGVFHAGNGLLPDGGGGFTQGGGVRRFPLDAQTVCGPPSAEVLACPTWATPLTTVSGVVIGPGEVLYVGRAGGSVVALDGATGAVLWETPVGADVSATPALAGGVLYVPTADGDLVAVDAAGCGAATCEPLWSAAIDGTSIAAQPAVSGDGEDAVVFVGTSGGTVAAVAAAGCGSPTCGAPRWQASVGAWVTGAPAVSGGAVVVGTASGQVAAFRLPAD